METKLTAGQIVGLVQAGIMPADTEFSYTITGPQLTPLDPETIEWEERPAKERRPRGRNQGRQLTTERLAEILPKIKNCYTWQGVVRQSGYGREVIRQVVHLKHPATENLTEEQLEICVNLQERLPTRNRS